jgi:hypothetical protein
MAWDMKWKERFLAVALVAAASYSSVKKQIKVWSAGQ